MPSSSWQRSPVEQGEPSSQVAPSALLVCTQPVIGLQLSSVQGLPSLQLTPVPVHAPFEQLSLVVHALPSLHVPAIGVLVQPVCGLQPSCVQTLLSLQFLAEPEQLSPAHVSFTVHSLPSLQGPTWFACWHTPLLQVSSVQNLPSSQFRQAPPFDPHCVGELTMHCWPEMQPWQQRLPRQTPPEHAAPPAGMHVPAPLHMLHSPQLRHSTPWRPQRLSSCSSK